MSKLWIDRPKSKNGNWVLRVRWEVNGKTREKQKSFPKDQYSKGEVNKIVKQLEVNDFLQNKDDMSYNPFQQLSNSPNPTWEMALESYLKEYETKVTKGTLTFHKSALTNFTKQIGKHTLCKQITFSDIKKFINASCTTTKSKTSYLTPFRSIFRHLNKEYNLDYTPEWETLGSKAQRRKESKKNPVILSEDDLWKMVNYALDNYDKESITNDIYSWVIYFYVGMRTEQIAWTKIRDIDLKNERIYIGRNKQTKTYDSRKVWLPPQCHETLQKLMEGKEMHDYLFDHSLADSSGRIMRTTSYRFKQVYKEVFPRRDEMVMYNLRHSCGCWLLEQEFSIMFVKNQLGHSNLDQVLTYAHMTGKSMDNEIAKYYERTNLNTQPPK